MINSTVFSFCFKYSSGYSISNKQNLENKAFQMGFTNLKIEIKEKFRLKTKLIKIKDKKLKISSIQVMQNLFSFQTPFTFLKSIHWFWRYNIWRKRLFPTLLSEKNTKKRGKHCLVMIDN